MPRRDKGCPSRRRNLNTLVLALAVPAAIGGAIYVGMMVVGGLGAVGDIGEVQAAQEEWAKAASLPTREQFAATVTGKTKDEVLAVLGKPAETRAWLGREYWIYYRVARGRNGHIPARHMPDRGVTLTFGDDGKVSSVDWSSE